MIFKKKENLKFSLVFLAVFLFNNFVLADTTVNCDLKKSSCCVSNPHACCIDRAKRWVEDKDKDDNLPVSDAHKISISEMACQGGIHPFEIISCLDSVWNWASSVAGNSKIPNISLHGTRDHRRYVAAMACKGNPRPLLIKLCLQRKWDEDKETKFNDERRSKAANECAEEARELNCKGITGSTSTIMPYKQEAK